MSPVTPVTTCATAAQISDQSPVSFSDSLLTASKAGSEAGLTASKVDSEAGSATNAGPKTTRQSKSTSGDAKTSLAVPDTTAIQSPIVSQLSALQQQGAPAQQTQLTSVAIPSMELPVAASVASSESTIAQSGVAALARNLSSYSQPGRGLLQSAPVSSASTINGIKPLSVAPSTAETSASDRGVTALSIADQSMIPNPVLNAVPEDAANSLSQSGLNAIANVAPGASSHAASNTMPTDIQSNATANGIQNSLPNAGPEDAANSPFESALNAIASAAQVASSNAASNTIPVAAPDAQSNTSLSQSVLSAVSGVTSSTSSNTMSNSAQVAATTAVSNGLQSSSLKAVLKAFAGVIPSGLTSTAPNTAAHATASAGQSSNLSQVQNPDANAVHIEVPHVASNAVSNTPLNTDPAPIAHTAQSASPKEGVAPETSSVSASRATASPASPDQTMPATGLNIPAATTDQLAAQNQFTGETLAASQAGLPGLNSTSVAKLSAVSSVNGKIGSKDAADEATGLKQHASSASNQTTFQTGSQDATSSADQSQVGASSQGQGTAVQGSFTSHAAIDSTHAQIATIASPVQSSPAPGNSTGHAAIASDRTAPAATAAPPAAPVINTAKLIQSAGQSEMRVGMRSNEFGNISISTSATRDSISAQISLDHGELAKTLAAHLPEIQARLGSNQPVDVRIDTSGSRGGLGAGTSGSFSDSTSGDSHGSRQQSGSAASSYSGNGFSDRQFSPAASAVTANDGGLNTRLDIRV